MTLPEGVQPSGPTVDPTTVDPTTEDGVSGATTPSSEAVVETPETPEEVASDAALRAWAKDNGIEGVPASGRLSVAWRDQITAAMTAALSPKEEDSVPDTSSPELSTSETTTEEEAPLPVAPEFETGTYRSVFKAPDTFVSGQAFTA